MKLGTWLLTLMQPMLAKILVSLGFSVVSVVGMEAALSGLKAQFISAANAMPAGMLQLFLLGGGGVALGIIFGAMATRLLLWQIQSSVKILGVNT
ncbi:DUF2523 family protein [Polaromonas aquatica]|uniref:DUF2523 family protein n=1 Tax=Polaromonas aquatica TaxID=332657 RepID=UPI003D652A23